MELSFSPSRARGQIDAPASKSMAHRLLICAGLSEGESVIHGIPLCEDVLATVDCLRAFGVECRLEGEDAFVKGCSVASSIPSDAMRCRESGSTLRFLLPLGLLSGGSVMFLGALSLMHRPMTVYQELCETHGWSYLQDGQSIVVKGPLTAGEYQIAGNVSSQFISGLLFALPLTQGESRIVITSSVESRPYIDLTLQALAEYGVHAEWMDDHTLRIPGGQSYTAHETTVEGDYSNAAFLDAFNLFGGEVCVKRLHPNSLQGDRVYRSYFEMLSKGTPTIHIGDCPDLGPILFAVAAAKYGGVFNGTRRLRIKESDRAAAMAAELRKFGTSVTVYDDTVVVYPAEFAAPEETLETYNDHRIVMALSVLLSITGGRLRGAEAVKKSFPEFFDVISFLGVRFSVTGEISKQKEVPYGQADQ